MANTEHSYDSNGNTETMTYPDGRVVTYTYDDADRVSRVTSVKLGTVKIHADNITHMPFGGVSSYTYGNGLTAVRTYDLDYRLRFLKSGPMVRRDYGYDDNGNITSITDLVNSTKSQSFTYDALDRLHTALGAYGNIVYDYDAVGNRVGDGNESLVFDDNGNVETDGGMEFEYEAGAPIKRSGMSMEGNLYVYTNSNPVNLIDSTGLKSSCCEQSYLECLSKCIQLLDPLSDFGKGGVLAAGCSVPKKALGLRRGLGGASDYTTLPSAAGLGNGTASAGNNLLRMGGRLANLGFFGYGFYLFGAESFCGIQCARDRCYVQ